MNASLLIIKFPELGIRSYLMLVVLVCIEEVVLRCEVKTDEFRMSWRPTTLTRDLPIVSGMADIACVT